MQFSVGDKVVHPQYGPGQIIGVEHRELVEGFEHYYVIELLIDETTLFIPMSRTGELGLRRVMSQAKLARVLETLQEAPRRLSKDFKVRQARIRDKLATARPAKVAETVRDLTGRRRRSYLTKVDKRLLTRARELLAAEMAVVNGIDVLYAHQTIDRALTGDRVRDSEVALSDSKVGKADAAERVRVIRTNLSYEQQTLVQKLLGRVQVENG
jgi:CarD family transcriptional regulator